MVGDVNAPCGCFPFTPWRIDRGRPAKRNTPPPCPPIANFCATHCRRLLDRTQPWPISDMAKVIGRVTLDGHPRAPRYHHEQRQSAASGLLVCCCPLFLRPDCSRPPLCAARPLRRPGGIYARSLSLVTILKAIWLGPCFPSRRRLGRDRWRFFVKPVPLGASCLPLSRTITNIGQTFPPSPCCAGPCLPWLRRAEQLWRYFVRLLPIFENADHRPINPAPPPRMEAARAGLNRWQRLWPRDSRSALPVIS